MPSIDDNAKKIQRLLRKREPKPAVMLAEALGYTEGRAISRPLGILVRTGQAVRTNEGYLKA